jgi:hypothetical protein
MGARLNRIRGLLAAIAVAGLAGCGSNDDPPPPPDVVPISSLYSFTPHRPYLNDAVTLELPYNAAATEVGDPEGTRSGAQASTNLKGNWSWNAGASSGASLGFDRNVF